MITPRRSHERGHADHGWLDTYHTFSFGGYHNPDFTQYGTLRVLNQDRVAPSQGFGTHPHHDMEIVSVVLEGVLEHKDSMGTGSQLRPGEVQLMSAGSGVTHSEFNPVDEPLHFLQMWILPATRGTPPRYEQKEFPEATRKGRLRLVVSPDGRDGSLTIGQDADLWMGHFAAGDAADQPLPEHRMGWLHVARGDVKVNDVTLTAGDGAAIEQEASLRIEGVSDADVVLWTLPTASPR